MNVKIQTMVRFTEKFGAGFRIPLCIGFCRFSLSSCHISQFLLSNNRGLLNMFI